MSNINLYHGDCMEAMRSMKDKQYDLVISDPPYFDGPQNPGYYKGTKQITDVGEYKTLKDSWKIPGEEEIAEMVRVSKHQIIWGINYFNVAMPGGRLVWVKGEQGSPFSMADIAYQSFYNRIDLFKYTWSGFWQEAGKEREERIHPTQKPVAVYKYCLKQYAKPGWKILDTHGGSMSIALACHDMDFDIDLWEIDADYYNAGVERYNNHVRFHPKNPLFENFKTDQ
jgi:site-specific DNA-methyltransferase (adenine-specific)